MNFPIESAAAAVKVLVEKALKELQEERNLLWVENEKLRSAVNGLQKDRARIQGQLHAAQEMVTQAAQRAINPPLVMQAPRDSDGEAILRARDGVLHTEPISWAQPFYASFRWKPVQLVYRGNSVYRLQAFKRDITRNNFAVALYFEDPR
jgi:hypothetical protein